MMDAMNELRLYIGDRLVSMEKMIHKEFGLTAITRFTLVARDPSNPNMYVVVTNEPQEAFEKVAGLITEPGAND